MDLERARKVIIMAVCSDDELCEKLVLKGGNALRLIHEIGLRTSLDVDFSMEEDFAAEGLEETERRLFGGLEDRFDSEGYVVFDRKFSPKPKKVGPLGPRWGGYRVEFKLIERKRHEELRGNLQELRKYALTVDGNPGSSRIFKIEISKFEFCRGREERELEGYTVPVYTLAMIAAEKLRALCQQMPECEPRGKQTARARDFYDIYQVVKAGVDFSEDDNQELVRSMFTVKDVNLSLLSRIEETRAFHAQDWPALELVLGTNADGDFDFYFDAVVRLLKEKLKALWVK